MSCFPSPPKNITPLRIYYIIYLGRYIYFIDRKLISSFRRGKGKLYCNLLVLQYTRIFRVVTVDLYIEPIWTLSCWFVWCLWTCLSNVLYRYNITTLGNTMYVLWRWLYIMFSEKKNGYPTTHYHNNYIGTKVVIIKNACSKT